MDVTGCCLPASLPDSLPDCLPACLTLCVVATSSHLASLDRCSASITARVTFYVGGGGWVGGVM